MLTRDDLPPTPEWYVQPHRDVEPAPVDLTLPIPANIELGRE